MLKVQRKYEILSNAKVTKKFFHLSLKAPTALLKKIKPGQFFHLRITDSLTPFFRRPFSVFRSQTSLDFLYEIVGPGTQLLSTKKKGDSIDCLGPLGKSFVLPLKKTEQVVLIAGGIGLAPMQVLSDHLKNTAHDVVLLYGGRSSGHVPSFREFIKNGCQVFVSTDDGSVGEKGRVDRLFKRINVNKKTFIYTCGPKPMIASVNAFAKEYCFKGQASLEEVMACGVGICLGCSIKTAQGFQTVCDDGPVFNLEDLFFEKGVS